MNKTTYEENIKNKEITDCVAVDKERLVFAIKTCQTIENDIENSISENRATTILVYAPKLIDNNDGFAKTIEYFKGIDQFKITYNKKLIVVSTSDFRVEEKEDNDLVSVIPHDFYMREVTSVCTVDNTTYALGLFHKVYRRKKLHDWVDITDPKKHPNLFLDLERRREVQGNIGGANPSFYALDGFSDKDIYAGGDNGDFWHFDGEKWREIELPINFNIRAITCATDGYVYVAGHNSLGILKGRDGSWKLICKNEDLLNINAMAWFKGHLYISDDNALYILKNETMHLFKFPKGDPQQHSFSKVKASEDILVAYGAVQALMFDGERCKEIIGLPKIN